MENMKNKHVLAFFNGKLLELVSRYRTELMGYAIGGY